MTTRAYIPLCVGIFFTAGAGAGVPSVLADFVGIGMAAGAAAESYSWQNGEGAGFLAGHPVHIAAAAQERPERLVEIDDRWLAANHPPPFILNRPGTYYRLHTDVSVPGTAFYVANEDITLDLNGHSIHYGLSGAAGTNGINLYLGWHNQEISIARSRDPQNFRLMGGAIINLGSGDRAHGVAGFRALNASIHDMYIETSGRDSAAVFFSNQGITLKDSVLVSGADSTFDRHAGPANVMSGSNTVARRNLLVGGNSGFFVGSDSIIQGNIISHNGVVTNGYGVFTYGERNLNIEDNIIIPKNGRGVLLNGRSGSDHGGHLLENNVILHMERPNVEFGTQLNATAIRTRYGSTRNLYRNNVSLGMAGGPFAGASGFYLSDEGGTDNTFVGNKVTTILVGESGQHTYAQPVSLEGHGLSESGPARTRITNNHFASNHLMLRVDGYDGGARQARPLRGNTWEWKHGDTAYEEFERAVYQKLDELPLLPRVRRRGLMRIERVLADVERAVSGVGLQPDRSFWFGFYYQAEPEDRFVSILDSVFGEGVDPATIQALTHNPSGRITCAVAESHRIRILREGVPAANVKIKVRTGKGDVVDVLETDDAGYVDVPIISFALEKPGPASIGFDRVDQPYTLLSLGDDVTSIVIEHDRLPDSITVSPGRSSSPPNPPMILVR